MDREARTRVIDEAMSMFDRGALAAVPANEYFTGNTHDGSFGRGMTSRGEIPVIEYARAFAAIAARPEVHAVYVKIHELPDDDDEDEREMWPSAFVVFVLTSAPPGEVERWLAPLEPRFADDWRPAPGVPVPWPEPPPGFRPVIVEMR